MRSETKDDQRPGLIYRGPVELVDSHVLLPVQGRHHREHAYLRILYPIPTMKSMTFGIFVGVNFDLEMYSTMYFLSREDMSDQAARILSDKLRQSMQPTAKALILY